MIRISNNTKLFMELNKKQIDLILQRMSGDVLNLSKMNVPFKSGELQKTSEIQKVKEGSYYVSYSTPYASYQERGRRRDGTREVRNYTSPDTNAHFLANAGKKVASKAMDYLSQGFSRIRI